MMTMKTSTGLLYFFLIALFTCNCCPEVTGILLESNVEKTSINEKYSHFQGGVLFSDVEFGLQVLWEASFDNGKVYRENLGFFTGEGLLILPNVHNTRNTSRITALPTAIQHNKLLVSYQGRLIEVVGIVHTHPDPRGIQTPTPVSDYQYCYLGIHNYIICRSDLYDAYKNSKGNEEYAWLGTRDSYAKIPFVNTVDENLFVQSVTKHEKKYIDGEF